MSKHHCHQFLRIRGDYQDAIANLEASIRHAEDPVQAQRFQSRLEGLRHGMGQALATHLVRCLECDR